MKLIEWRPVVKNTLRGFATIELTNGLVIADVSIHVVHGKFWASLPAKPQTERDGTPRRGADGKALYSPILKWRDRDLADRFSAAVIDLVRSGHPGALEGGAQ